MLPYKFEFILKLSVYHEASFNSFEFFGLVFSDNDLVIGNKNRCKKERSSVLKNSNLVKNRHALCKTVPKTTEDSINSKKSKDDEDESKGKKGSIVAGGTQRGQIRTGKPSSMRI